MKLWSWKLENERKSYAEKAQILIALESFHLDFLNISGIQFEKMKNFGSRKIANSWKRINKKLRQKSQKKKNKNSQVALCRNMSWAWSDAEIWAIIYAWNFYLNFNVFWKRTSTFYFPINKTPVDDDVDKKNSSSQKFHSWQFYRKLFRKINREYREITRAVVTDCPATFLKWILRCHFKVSNEMDLMEKFSA